MTVQQNIERQTSRFEMMKEGFTPLPSCRFHSDFETQWVLDSTSTLHCPT